MSRRSPQNASLRSNATCSGPTATPGRRHTCSASNFIVVPRVLTFQDLAERWGDHRPLIGLRNAKSGMVAAEFWAPSHMDEEGAVIPHVQLMRPTKSERMRVTALDESNWGRIDGDTFRALWDGEVAVAREKIDVETINVRHRGCSCRSGTSSATISSRSGGSPTVRAIRISAASSAEAGLGELAKSLGVTIATDVNVPALVTALERGDARVVLPGTDLTLITAPVNGSRRIELKGYDPAAARLVQVARPVQRDHCLQDPTVRRRKAGSRWQSMVCSARRYRWPKRPEREGHSDLGEPVMPIGRQRSLVP